MTVFTSIIVHKTEHAYCSPMAAVTLLAAPTAIVFLVLQRFFVEGVRMSGIKG